MNETAVDHVSYSQIEELGRLMEKLYQCCQERHARECDRFGLPQAELRVLLAFGEERYLAQTALGRRLGLAKSRVTKLVGALAEKGLLRRVDDPGDARVTLLALTGDGARRAEAAREYVRSVNKRVLGCLAPDERESLLATLGSLRAALEEYRDEA